MFRQTSSRNHRNKGLKVKHALQICLLLAVCFWLLYQVKHSHDKKKAFDESNAKISENLQTGEEILKLGRKDPSQKAGVSSSEMGKHHVEDENEEEEENRHEENEEEGNNHEESESEGRGGGDDEIDEHDQERSNEESERQEDILDEEKEDEDSKDDVKEEVEILERQEDEEEVVKHEHDEIKETVDAEESEQRKENSHEAREAQYHGDDASSAVVKENMSLEGVKADIGNPDDDKKDEPDKNAVETNGTEDLVVPRNTDDDKEDAPDKNTIQNDKKINGTVDHVDSGSTGGDEKEDRHAYAIENDNKINGTVEAPLIQGDTNTSSLTKSIESNAINGTETGGTSREVSLLNVENGSLTNSTAGIEEKEVDTNTMRLGNDTAINLMLPSGQESGAEDQGSGNVEHNLIGDKNITAKVETASDQENPDLPQAGLVEPTEKSNSTKEVAEGQDKNLTTTLEATAEQTERKNSTVPIGESDNNPISSILEENSEAFPGEGLSANSSTVTQEMKEALTDLETLPETGSATENSDGVAAE